MFGNRSGPASLIALALWVGACAPAPAPPASPTMAPTSTEGPAGTQAALPAMATPQVDQVITFVLDSGSTQARFIIDEILRGAPNTVVGSTAQVTGEIHIDLGSPAQSDVGPIRVEAGTLATDSSFRDRAIRTFILQTSNFPVVTFSPSSVEGLPAAVAVGETFTITITGELAIRDISHPVTFEVTINAESEERLRGLASATILRSDYGLTIPSVPNVADVSEEVRLELEFVAVRG